MADAPTIEFGLPDASDPTPRVGDQPKTIEFGDPNIDTSEPNKWTGAAGLPEQPIPWSDVGHQVASGVHGALGAGASLLSSYTDESQPEIRDRYARFAEDQRKAAQESLEAETYTGRAAREGHFWQHPIVQTAEQAPGLAAMAAPAIIGSAVAGPAGAIAGGIAGWSQYQRGQDVNQFAGDIMDAPVEHLRANPEFDKLTQYMSDDDAKRLYIQNELARNGLANRSALIGAVAGAAAEVAGPWAGKLAGHALTRLALSGGKDAVLLGGQSAASTVATGTAEQQAGIRGPVTPEETFQSGLEGAEGGVLFSVIGAARHGSGESGKTRLPKGGVSSEGTGSERDYGKTETKTPSPTAVEATNTGPASPSSPVGSAEELALKGQQAPAPTPRVGEQQVTPVVQPSGGEQPVVETAQEAVGAPPAGIEPSPVSPPPPTPPAPPTPEPTQPVAESEATRIEQQAALLDPQNPREAMIYPKGVKPIGIVQNRGRFGATRLADGRWVQYDTRGPRHLNKTLIAEYEKNNDLNGLLQLGDVPQTEAVEQSVAGAEPAVVTERAPPSTPGSPGVERKAAAGTTATAPSQVEALEATKTPGSTVQVETPEETIGDRFKRVQQENVAKQQAESQPAPKEATPEATSRVEPTKMAETKHLSVWDRGDGTYFKRYTADGREENITKTVADLLAKNEPYVPAEKIDLAATRTEAPPPASERRILRSETEEEKQAAARQAEADAAAAQRVQEGAAAAASKAKPEPKPKEEQQPKKRGEEKDNELIRVNQVAKDVVAAHPPQDKEALAISPERGSGGTGARKALLERATKMVEAAKTADYKFMRPLRERVGETNHPNEGVLLHEAELFSRKKVPKTGDARRFMWAENELRNNGEAGRKAVMRMRSETGRDWAVSGGGPTIEVSHEGVEGGEAKGIEHVEKPDVAEEMAAAKERVAEEEVAKKPGEERKLTENERRAQEASERARAKLEAREKAAPSGVEGRVRPAEGEGRAEAPAPKAAVGFQVAKKGERVKLNVGEKLKAKEGERTKGDEEDTLSPEEKPTDDKKTGDDNAPAEGYHRYRTGPEKDDYVDLKKSRPSTTAGAAIFKHLDLNKYAPWLAKMVEKLRDAVIDIAGDTPVHYVSHAELTDKLGHSFRGIYRSLEKNPYIILNSDKMSHETALHEAFHGATLKGIASNPALAASLRTMRNMLEKYVRDNPELHVGLDADTLHRLRAALKDERGIEMLTYVMTNEGMQNLFKGAKITEAEAKNFGVAGWLKKTMWEGALSLIRRGINSALGREAIGPRDMPAIAAMMRATEEAMWAHPRGTGLLFRAAERYNRNMVREHFGGDFEDTLKAHERDQEAFMRSPREQLSRVGDIDKSMMKEFTKDKLTNLGGAIMKGSAKLLSGTWLDDMHGHLFRDAKGAILQAINDARNKVSHQYSRLMSGDTDHINRGYMLDKIYASRMSDYGKLLDMSVRYNIRADQAAPKQSKARKNWQRDTFGDEARALLKSLPEDLQKRYATDLKLYRDKQSAISNNILEKTLPLFDTPIDPATGKPEAIETVLARARRNDMTDEDWEHYENLGVAGPLREAYRFANGNEVFANSQRGDGRWVVTGHYDMPKGGSETSHSGESLPDNQREFDTEAAARVYATGTRMKATTREAYYVKDGKGYSNVYPETPETTKAGIAGKLVRAADAEITKYRVSLERQNYQVADSRAEAQRNRQAMEADGVKNLSGVMDRRDEKSWSDLNSADQNLLERKIDARKDLTDVERQHMKDVTRQMMLASRGSMGGHMIQARKVAGARFDSASGLHAYMRAANFHIARQSHAAELSDAMSRLDAHEKATRAADPDNATRRSIIASEMRDRVFGVNANALNSKSSPFMHKVMTWAFINFLVRPSHIILSQLHPYIYSVPMLAARHGYWKSLQGQRQAMRDLGGMGHNLWEGAKAGYDVYKSGGEQNIDKAVAMARGVDPILRMINGLKDKTERDHMMRMWETEHLHSAFDASVFSGGGMDRTNAIVKQFTDAMEANNRLSTALNAFRLERDTHKDLPNALSYARRVIEQTHGVFSPTNAASVFKNPIMRPIMQFRQQPMNLAIMMYRNIARSMPEKWGGDANNEARWTLAYQLGTAAALGGMGGMPMDLPKLAGLGVQAVGGPSPADWDDKFYRMLVDNLGKTVADLIHDGLPGVMGPYGPSLGHRTGFDAGFLFGEPKSDNVDDLFGYTAKSLAGASVGMGLDWMNALHQAEQGNWERAGEYVMPGSLKDILKAYRNATQGGMAGKLQVSPPSVGDELLQLMGFSGVERERMMAGHFALQKAIKADQAEQAANKPLTYGERLKQAQQARKDNTVLGVKVSKKQTPLAREYSNVYQ